MADANSAYTLGHTEHLADLDAYRLLMIEQPLAQDDLRRHAQLQDRLETPICLDESIPHAAAAEDMLALGAGRIVNIKPGRVGGFTQAKAIHGLCQHHAVPVWCGGMLRRAASAAPTTSPSPRFPTSRCRATSARAPAYWTEDVVTPEWTMDSAGMVTVPADRPGLGVAVNAEPDRQSHGENTDAHGVVA